MILTSGLLIFWKIINVILENAPSIRYTIGLNNQMVIDYVDLIMENAGLIDLVVPLNVLKPTAVAFLAVIGLKYAYAIIMWIIHKIPFIHIS